MYEVMTLVTCAGMRVTGGDGRSEGPGSAEEADRGGGLLIIQGFGVGQVLEPSMAVCR